MNKLEELSKELASLKEKRQHLLNERDRARREIEITRREAIQLTLDGSDISKLADKSQRLEFGVDVNITAVEWLDVKIRNVSAFFEAEQRAQDMLEREKLSKLEQEQALYR